ncbi:MAG: beta strand repeat-containing protein [Vicinamibacterales bacterium]
MRRSRSIRVLATIGFALAPLVAVAQTTTYHLHSESSSVNPIYLQLKTAGPDPASVAYQSGDLKGMSPHSSGMRIFETQAGVPGLGGTIPSGSTITFTLWMKKTASFGTMYPQASMKLNDSFGVFFCQATGTSALTTTLTAYEISCPTGSTINMATTDRLWLAAGYSMTVGPGNKSVKVELDIEGTLNGPYDSRVVVPNPIPPSITTLNPTSGPVNWPVTISGSNFGATQGSSTVAFNGTAATATSWSTTSIGVTVPPGATTGPVVVTVGGAASNGVPFTVIPPPAIASAAPASAHRGETVTISGTNFLATQGSSTITFNGTTATPTGWNDTTIVTTVPSTATTGPIVVTVSNQPSNGLAFTVIIPGTIGGTITRATGGAALAGATIQAVHTGIIKATATSAANGTYTIPNLDPGTYDVRVHATGYSSEVRSNTVVVPETTTTVDVAMSQPGSISGKVTQADGVTPLVGAAVTLFLGGIEKGSASTNATGDYSVSGLHVGAYTVQAAFVGYRTKEQGATILENANTTSNLALSPMPAGPVTYAYDELGRLVMVVDAAGDAATYTYDAVGNILSIGRIGAGTVSIVEFTPNGAPVGATVTIFGTGFSETAGQNTVTFNGVAASVTSSTATQIVTTVPAGATTGPIGVSTPTGSATSGTSFTVTTAPAAPSISSFTPTIAPAGTALTINGANFDPVAANNRVTVNTVFASLSSVTSTALGTAIPGGATSGKITVMTPNGTAVSADDLYIPPPPFTAADVEFRTRMGFGEAAALTVPINAANRIALVLFDASAGQRVALKVDNVMVTTTTVKLLSPTGLQLASDSFGTGGTFIDPVDATVTGTYTVVVDPALSYTGSLRLTLYDVPPDASTPIAPGGPEIQVTADSPGRRAYGAFTATAGQRVSLNVSALTIGTGSGCKAAVSILGPAGDPVATNACVPIAGVFLDVTPPLVTGPHKVLVDPIGALTGSATLRLHNVPADFAGPITPGGSAVTVPIDQPGQNGILSFTGAVGQRVAVSITGNTTSGIGTCTVVSLRRPAPPVSDGSIVSSLSCVNITTAFLDVATLDVAGTHTILVNPTTDRTGVITLHLHNVPADVTGSLTINGPDALFANNAPPAPGQNGDYTFTGANQQQIRLHVRESTFTPPSPCVRIQLRRRDAQQQWTIVLQASNVCSASLDLSQVTLPADDLYMVRVDPIDAGVGSLRVNVTSP